MPAVTWNSGDGLGRTHQVRHGRKVPRRRKIKLSNYMKNSPQTDQPVALHRLVRHLAARFGYVLMPITEIERMESDAESYYVAMKRKPYITKSAKAYFNGVADYSSKSAHRLRGKYLPNG